MPLAYDALLQIRNDGVGLIDIVEYHDPNTPIAACPEWTLSDLAWHVGKVWDFWSRVVEEHMTDVETVKTIVEPGKLSGDALIEWITASHTAIYAALVDARPEREVWTWTGQNQNVEWVRRRMAQETAVHRWDAQLAAGATQPIDAALAVDGIDEFLTWFMEPPGDGPGGSIHIHAADAEGEWYIEPSGERWTVEREHRKGDVALRGPASDLLLALWRRVPRTDLDVVGDEAVADRFLGHADLE